MQQINADNILDNEKIGDKPKLLLQIIHDEFSYKQYYNLFLPAYENNATTLYSCFICEELQKTVVLSLITEKTILCGLTFPETELVFKEVLKKLHFYKVYNMCFELHTDCNPVKENVLDILVFEINETYANYINILNFLSITDKEDYDKYRKEKSFRVYDDF
ncbi:hypothetical protein COBT_003888, partial [Conglomerata obtusa]